MEDEKTVIADLRQSPSAQVSGRACLVQYKGPQVGKRIFPEDSYLIGRAVECQILEDDPSISRKHVIFRIQNERVFIENLGSSNGTFVNEKKIVGTTELSDQSMVRLGSLTYKFFHPNSIDGVIQDEIYRRATVDSLTDTFNKAALLEQLAEEVRIFKKLKSNLCLAYFDLDFFKKVNDTYGHNFGDLVLKHVARVVKESIRKQDFFARFGGEEFVIILPRTDISTAVALGERVRSALEATSIQSSGISHKQTLSMGVAQFSDEIGSLDNFLEVADKKLYEAKRSGRNKVCY